MDYGMIKKYTYKTFDENDNEIERTLTFKYSPLTYVIYKNNVGSDLFADMDALNKPTNVKITADTRIEDLTDKDIEELSNTTDTSAMIIYYSKLLAAMVLTARRNENLDFEEVMDDIPISIFHDSKFMGEIMELVTFGLKKK